MAKLDIEVEEPDVDEDDAGGEPREVRARSVRYRSASDHGGVM